MQQIRRSSFLIMICLVCLAMGGCQKKSATFIEDGAAYLESGDLVEAKGQFEMAASRGIFPGEAYRGLALCYFQEGDFEKARGAFAKAVHEGAEVSGALYHMWGTCEYRLGDMVAAIDFFEKGINSGDASEEAVQEMAFNIISAYEKLEEYEIVKERLAAYTTQYPEDAEAAKEAAFFATR